MRILAAIGAFMALAIPASIAHGTTDFRSPTGNIVCSYFSLYESDSGIAFVGCQTRNSGLTVTVSAVGDRERDYLAPFRGTSYYPVLRYGRSRYFPGIVCTSRFTGMTCVSRMTGQGFFVSRATWSWVG